ncbi:hypothetical protein [Chryseobacterium sp. MP_3.2]|uniref:hypothetical protein n=1 Tax=Chryseobacterium sp. MP_3.2 TaxID=3071712 RepID=UPI002DFBBB5A|nr:prolipoprotein diacylglyceryltransferase [Chryseobacterium sp. MP_3.2]
MTDTKTFTLISGQFSPKESSDILTSVFKSKMQFHRMKNFSNQERFGKVVEHSHHRIKQLQETLGEISKLLEDAEKQGEILEIRSEIKISAIKSLKDH